VTVAIVPDSAHAPMLEHPAAFCAALDDVLARLAR
jgi:pimeloyl-ACP methyl ester carboxylesterase